MLKLISKSRFKAQALELFRQIESSGIPIIISDHGQPRLEIRPYKASARLPLEALRGSLLRFDSPTLPVAHAQEAKR